MKKLILAILLASVSVTTSANTVEPLPNDPPYVALFAPVTMVVVLGFSLTGQGEALCSKMGGTWEPFAAGNNCPGGRWARFYGLI